MVGQEELEEQKGQDDEKGLFETGEQKGGKREIAEKEETGEGVGGAK